MTDSALDVVELLVTAAVYSENRSLDEDDLPPRIRTVFWSGAADSDADGDDESTRPGSRRRGVERPLTVTASTAREATGVDDPWGAVSDLLFTERSEFSGSVSLTDLELASEWLADRIDAERVRSNPTLAAHYDEAFDVDRETAREHNRPVRADRVWIDSLLEEYFDDEEEEEMLDLVDIRAPEEIEMTLDELVLTSDQEAEIEKIVKAIEHREYLAQIGLREIGKLLFVGPPGTGKTSTARALRNGSPRVSSSSTSSTSSPRRAAPTSTPRSSGRSTRC